MVLLIYVRIAQNVWIVMKYDVVYKALSFLLKDITRYCLCKGWLDAKRRISNQFDDFVQLRVQVTGVHHMGTPTLNTGPVVLVVFKVFWPL